MDDVALMNTQFPSIVSTNKMPVVSRSIGKVRAYKCRLKHDLKKKIGAVHLRYSLGQNNPENIDIYVDLHA
jgi:hypothetical protein